MAKNEIKVVMLGKECSGKTSIVERFLSERYAGEHKYQTTVGCAFGQRFERSDLNRGMNKERKIVYLGHTYSWRKCRQTS